MQGALQPHVHPTAPQPGCSYKESVIELPDDEVCFVVFLVFYNFLTPLRTALGELVVAQIIKKLDTFCAV